MRSHAPTSALDRADPPGERFSSPREDLFLRVELARSGLVRGEAVDRTHGDEIELAAWDWGMHASTRIAGSGPATRATLRELRIEKRVDRSTPALMAALRSNEEIRTATLSTRKAGAGGADYLRIRIGEGRIVDYRVSTSGAEVREVLSLSFRSIEVEYRAQGSDGQLGGAVTFSDRAA